MRAPRRLRPPCPQEVKALQTATREAIELLQAMVEEVRRSAAEEEAAIQALFSSMQVRGRGTKQLQPRILISMTWLGPRPAPAQLSQGWHLSLSPSPQAVINQRQKAVKCNQTGEGRAGRARAISFPPGDEG